MTDLLSMSGPSGPRSFDHPMDMFVPQSLTDLFDRTITLSDGLKVIFRHYSFFDQTASERLFDLTKYEYHHLIITFFNDGLMAMDKCTVTYIGDRQFTVADTASLRKFLGQKRYFLDIGDDKIPENMVGPAYRHIRCRNSISYRDVSRATPVKEGLTKDGFTRRTDDFYHIGKYDLAVMEYWPKIPQLNGVFRRLYRADEMPVGTISSGSNGELMVSLPLAACFKLAVPMPELYMHPVSGTVVSLEMLSSYSASQVFELLMEPQGWTRVTAETAESVVNQTYPVEFPATSKFYAMAGEMFYTFKLATGPTKITYTNYLDWTNADANAEELSILAVLMAMGHKAFDAEIYPVPHKIDSVYGTIQIDTSTESLRLLSLHMRDWMSEFLIEYSDSLMEMVTMLSNAGVCPELCSKWGGYSFEAMTRAKKISNRFSNFMPLRSRRSVIATIDEMVKFLETEYWGMIGLSDIATGRGKWFRDRRGDNLSRFSKKVEMAYLHPGASLAMTKRYFTRWRRFLRFFRRG